MGKKLTITVDVDDAREARLQKGRLVIPWLLAADMNDELGAGHAEHRNRHATARARVQHGDRDQDRQYAAALQ